MLTVIDRGSAVTIKYENGETKTSITIASGGPITIALYGETITPLGCGHGPLIGDAVAVEGTLMRVVDRQWQAGVHSVCVLVCELDAKAADS